MWQALFSIRVLQMTNQVFCWCRPSPVFRTGIGTRVQRPYAQPGQMLSLEDTLEAGSWAMAGILVCLKKLACHL